MATVTAGIFTDKAPCIAPWPERLTGFNYKGELHEGGSVLNSKTPDTFYNYLLVSSDFIFSLIASFMNSAIDL